MAFHLLNMGFAFAALSSSVGMDNASWRSSATSEVCSLGQKLAAGNRVLTITKSLGTDETNFAIEEPRGKVTHKRLKNVRVQLDSGWSADGSAITGSTQVPTTSLTSVVVSDPQFIEHLRSASEIVIHHPELGSIRVPFGSSKFPVSDLRECEDTRLRSLGIDPAYWRALPKPLPIVPVGTLIDYRDYSPEMVRNRIGGTTVVRLTVGTDGRVQTCVPLKKNVEEVLNRTTCRLITRRARFKPARDLDGNPVIGGYLVSMTYRIAGI